MTDIVERLREAEDDYKALRDEEAWALTHDAADTIEALQARIRALEEALSRMARAVRDAADGAGTRPAKESVRIVTHSWHTILDRESAARDVLKGE